MDQNTKPGGQTILKVTGILMIIGGALGLILGIFALIGVFALNSIDPNGEINKGALILATIITLVSAVIELVAGIMGVKNCAVPEKANTCLILGIAVACISVIANIISMTSGGSASVVSWITGLILPVLYIFGAYKNKSEAV